MSFKDSERKYALSASEMQMLDEYAQIPLSSEEGAGGSQGDSGPSPTDVTTLISRLVLSDEHDEFVSFASETLEQLADLCEDSPTLKEVLELAFRYFISNGSGTCACNFGALFYSGTIFEQDYERAKELYEVAVELGNDQALINLGYIYEYGRVGEPDYAKAYEIYSRAAALVGNFEALYKLGDMYSRGRGVNRDLDAASSLWFKSYDVSECRLEKGHAAFRLAKAFISDEAEKYGVRKDALSALILFQEAEIGFRLEIKNGAYYYEKNLRASIEGQKTARAFLEADE